MGRRAWNLVSPYGLILFVFLLLAATAQAQDSSREALNRARQLIDDFQFAEAAAVLEDLISRTTDPAVELEARERLVTAWASAGEDERARDAADRLYQRDPGHELEDPDQYSPRIRSVFSDARSAAQSQGPAEIRHLARESGGSLVLRLTVPSQAIIAESGLWAKTSEEVAFHTVTMQTEENRYTATIPLPEDPDDGFSVQFFARFKTPSGSVAAELGSETAPIEWRPIDVAGGGGGGGRGGGGGGLSKGAIWGIVGGSLAAAGIAATVAFVVTRPEKATLGTLLEIP